MVMTPLDYWKAGMDFWLKTAEAQIELSFKLAAAMPVWDMALTATRSIEDERVTLKSTSSRPVLRDASTSAPAPVEEAPAKRSTQAGNPVNAAAPALKPPAKAAKPASKRATKPATNSTNTAEKKVAPAASKAPAKAQTTRKPTPAKTASARKSSDSIAASPAEDKAPAAANTAAAPASRGRRPPSAPPGMPAAAKRGPSEE